MWFGKAIGGLIGLLVFGPIGAIIGLFIGHYYDNRDQLLQGFGSAPNAETKQVFFQTLYRLLGHLAKADGRVSEAEVAQTEALMRRSGLTQQNRQLAIALFKEGANAAFNRELQLQIFLKHCGHRGLLKQTLLVYLVNMALADGRIEQQEYDLLSSIANKLGFARSALDQIIRMLAAQTHFRGQSSYQQQQQYSGGTPPPTPQDELKIAYQALGVDASISDAELKKRYRKLMSENHPDKLMGQGVPEDMVQMATERAQEIQAAYGLIKKSREQK